MRDVAQFMKALADESRLQMLWLLFNHRELCVCDLMDVLEITQSKTSRHLATLRHAGLVTDRREGAWSYYAICPGKNELEVAVLRALRAKLASHPDAERFLDPMRLAASRKERAGRCSTNGPCRSKPTKTPAKSRKAKAPVARGSQRETQGKAKP